MNEPNYILKFNDGLMVPKKESMSKDIVKVLLGVFCIILIVLIIVFGFEILTEIPITTWICLLLGIGFLKKQGGYERKPSPCELWFYDNYIIQYCPRRYYDKKNIRKEYYKFYYKDITKCLYHTVVRKFDIYGIVEATFYKYDKHGNVSSKPCKHIKVESISVFYTIFEPDIDFVKEIETHSPIRIQYEEN